MKFKLMITQVNSGLLSSHTKTSTSQTVEFDTIDEAEAAYRSARNAPGSMFCEIRTIALYDSPYDQRVAEQRQRQFEFEMAATRRSLASRVPAQTRTSRKSPMLRAFAVMRGWFR